LKFFIIIGTDTTHNQVEKGSDNMMSENVIILAGGEETLRLLRLEKMTVLTTRNH
jgi:hypothetical protein